MKNKERFAKDILDAYLNEGTVALNKKTNKFTSCTAISCDDCEFYDEIEDCYVMRREWANKEYVETILDNTEKNYLGAVIKPFKNRVKYIVKRRYAIKEEFIDIQLDSEKISLPFFKIEKMYKGMEVDKKYTLKELGL